MSILQKLKSLLGLGDDPSKRRHDRDVGVTVERESGGPDEPAESDGRAVDAGPVSSPRDESDDALETDTADAPEVDDAPETDTADADESVEQKDEPTDREADADDEPTDREADTDDEPTDRKTDADDEPTGRETDADEGVAAGSSASSSTDTMVEPTESPEEAAEPAEATGPTAEDATPTADKTAESVDSVPVDDIKGIGPAYSDRLAAAGVETVSDLAAADAADLAQETDISEKRLQGWIDRAQVR